MVRTLLFLLVLAPPLFAQLPKPLVPTPGDFNTRQRTFDEKLHSHSDDPSPVVVVLLADRTYLEFFPADVLTLRQLIDKLPPGALKPTSRLLLIRKHEGLAFNPKGLKREDLTQYSLKRWDMIKIEDPEPSK